MSARRRVAVLISGRGSNLLALIEAAKHADYPAEIVGVLSNVAEAGGLAHARAAHIVTAVVPHKGLGRAAFEAAMEKQLGQWRAEIVCLAGFMRLLTPAFVERWRDRLINIHPSLLPAFPGLDTHGRALAAGVRFTGCTVHFVRAETDSGPIIAQAAVPVVAGDTEASLAARVLAAEHRVYPLALRLVAEGRARVVDERVVIDGAKAPDAALLNPTDGA